MECFCLTVYSLRRKDEVEDVDALHKKKCDSICYTTHGMLTLMFMKNTCSNFPDSKQVGMPESKQHTMFTNLVSHFSSFCWQIYILESFS